MNGKSAGAITFGDIASLAHKFRDNSMKHVAFIVQRFLDAANIFASFTGAQTAKVFGSTWHGISEQLEFDSTGRFVVDCDIKKNVWILTRHCK